MHTISKSYFVIIILMASSTIMGMQAPAVTRADVESSINNFNLLKLCQEQTRLWNQLKIMRSDKSRTFKAAGALVFGAAFTLGTILINKLVPLTVNRVTGLALNAVYGIVLIPGWLVFDRLLKHYFINCFSSVAHAHQEKHDFEQSIINKIRQTNISSQSYDAFLATSRHTAGRFASKLQSAIVSKMYS